MRNLIPCSIGLFVFAMTSGVETHWIGGVIGITLIGFGIYMIFFPSLNYIVDTYLQFTASAVAANTLLRSFFGAAFRNLQIRVPSTTNYSSTLWTQDVSRVRRQDRWLDSRPYRAVLVPDINRLPQVWRTD